MTGAERLRRRHRDEEGMVTAFVVVFTFALLLLAGLVIDGGLTLAARVQAINEAQAAARAGAEAINIPLFRSTGQIVLDPAQANQAAESYLAATGHTGTVQVNGDDVDVTVSNYPTHADPWHRRRWQPDRHWSRQRCRPVRRDGTRHMTRACQDRQRIGRPRPPHCLGGRRPVGALALRRVATAPRVAELVTVHH